MSKHVIPDTPVQKVMMDCALSPNGMHSYDFDGDGKCTYCGQFSYEMFCLLDALRVELDEKEETSDEQ